MSATSPLVAHSTTSRPTRIAVLRALTCLGAVIAATAHVVQLAAVGPAPARAGGWLSQPRDFNAWIAESVGWGMFVAGWVACRRHEAWSARWRAFSPPIRSRLLGGVLAGIVGLFGIGHWLTGRYPAVDIGWLKMTFMLASEYRPPAVFSTLQLWLAAAFAFGCWRLARTRVWLVTAVICGYMGADELFTLHEIIGAVAGRSARVASAADALWVGGITVGRWEVMFAPLALALGVWLAIEFRKVLSGFELVALVVAGAVFLGGALGMEVLEHRYTVRDRDFVNTDLGRLNVLIEECMEMLGVTLAVVVFSRRYWALRAGSQHAPA